MLLKRGPDLKYSDITPREIYLNRRKFLYGMGLAGGLALAGRSLVNLALPSARAFAAAGLPGIVKSPFSTTEKVTPEKVVTTYSNYYEFGTDKGDPARNAGNFVTSPWFVSVEGEVGKPRRFTIEKLVEPNSNAKYVAFESYFDKKQIPLWGRAGIQLPYVEGLRLDEAMHPLALLCVGMYGESLPNQDGAPVRMVLPWKYGFKSIKSLVKIKFVKDLPPTTWNIANAHEYGFYSNVNPQVDHPRWTQASERRLDGSFFGKRIPTAMFNGYADQVASLYSGMDLRKNY